jgi:predicted transcriptional regulator
MRLTKPEWQIMNALWENHPATAREVEERLPENVSWAYTTIKTMLTRLAAKNAVSERKRGNTSVYEPVISRDVARHSALSSLIDHAFGGAVEPFLGFVARDDRLSDRQRGELLEVLSREDATAEEES